MDQDQELQRRLAEATATVDRLQTQAEKQRRSIEGWKKELGATRNSVWDPLPGLQLLDRVEQVIDQVVSERLSLLDQRHLRVLARQVLHADQTGRQGLIIEAGTARGGSAIAMAAAKDPARPMRVYDVFGQIPAPGEQDGKDVHDRYQVIASGQARGAGGGVYYGYRDELYAEVTDSFARLGVAVGPNNVALIQGLFEDTIAVDEPVAFAHIDGDWYESTMTCLERIAPRLVRGGRLVLDDYFHWSGCRKAVDEYFANRPDFVLERRKKLHVVRV